MNGAELTPAHGFPARLVVPGWVGAASIKWLGALEVATERQSRPGTRGSRSAGQERVRAGRGRAARRRPAAPAHRPLVVGQRPIRAVDVSADEQHVWTRWELPWTPAAGRHELLARATDRAGLTQPDQVPLNQGGHYRAVVRYPVTAA